MFLTARLFGIFIYIFVMCLFLFLTRYTTSKQRKYIFVLYLFVLCVMAWLFVPPVEKDIVRLQVYAQHLAELPWNEFWYHITNSASGIFTDFYFRFFPNSLAVVTCFIVFGVIFYIIYKSSEKLQIKNIALTVVLLWIMTNDFYVFSITNIRSYVAVAFCCFCIYREIFQKKFGILNIILYLCAVQMHSLGIALVILRVIAYFFMDFKFSGHKIILLPFFILIAVIGLPYYTSLVSDSTDKFISYYTNEYYSYVWERVFFTIQTFVQVYILFKAYSYKIFKDKEFSSYKSIVVLSVVVLLISQINITFVQRWIIFSAVLEIPLLFKLLKTEDSLRRSSIKNFIIITSLITFAFVSSRGHLCSFKFWE